jgi:hypothetical protein
VDCIPLNPERVESREQLYQKYLFLSERKIKAAGS